MTKQKREPKLSVNSSQKQCRRKKTKKPLFATHGKKGRPSFQLKQLSSPLSPYEIQNLFTQKFIKFGEQYLSWKLSQNYIWSKDFISKVYQNIEKLPIDNVEHQEALGNTVDHICKMMEEVVGREFRECCIEIYQGLNSGEGLEYMKQRIVSEVLFDERYSYLAMKNESIPKRKKTIKTEMIPEFIKLTVELINELIQNTD